MLSLSLSGFGECWDNQEILNVTWFKRAIDLRLKDIDRQDWLSNVNENGQCLNYSIGFPGQIRRFISQIYFLCIQIRRFWHYGVNLLF